MATNTVRSAVKPNSKRRHAIRLSLGSLCATCDLPVCWSAATPDQAPHKATLGHVVADSIGGTYRPGNIVAQCWACNIDAIIANATDLTNDCTMIPQTWVAQKVADNMNDIRTCEPMMVVNYDDERIVRAKARKARGLAW